MLLNLRGRHGSRCPARSISANLKDSVAPGKRLATIGDRYEDTWSRKIRADSVSWRPWIRKSENFSGWAKVMRTLLDFSDRAVVKPRPSSGKSKEQNNFFMLIPDLVSRKYIPGRRLCMHKASSGIKATLASVKGTREPNATQWTKRAVSPKVAHQRNCLPHAHEPDF